MRPYEDRKVTITAVPYDIGYLQLFDAGSQLEFAEKMVHAAKLHDIEPVPGCYIRLKCTGTHNKYALNGLINE